MPAISENGKPVGASLCIQLFGGLEVSRNGQPLRGLQDRQGERLLAYLALRKGRSVASATLAGVFWPATESLDSLRQALLHLRRVLGEEAGRLETARGVVSLNLEGAWVDVDAFDAAIADNTPDALRHAVDIYRGPLLDGWAENWLDKERKKRAEAYVEALYALAQHALSASDYRLAANCLHKYARCRPGHERGWLEWMQALHKSGERLAALEVYHKYRDYLNRTHNLVPPLDMTALYHDIQAGELPAIAAVAPTPGGVADSDAEETIGGAMPLKSPFYVSRPIDAQFQAAIAHQESIALVKGARQTGKSSLLARGLHHARKRGAAVVMVSFETFSEQDLHSMEAVCLRLITCLSDALDLEFTPAVDWNPLLGPNVNLERYLLRRVMTAISAPLVCGLDELDRLFARPFSGEFFSMLRSWHEKRAFEPTKPWKRLTLALTCATEAHLYIADVNKSPFNVGARLMLNDFTLSEVEELNRCYGLLLNPEELSAFFELTGGHPYLTRLGLREMARREPPRVGDVAQLEACALRPDSPFGDHLRRLETLLEESPALRQATADVLLGRSCAEESFLRLRSGGILRGEDREHALLRCRLYEAYLRKQMRL